MSRSLVTISLFGAFSFFVLSSFLTPIVDKTDSVEKPNILDERNLLGAYLESSILLDDSATVNVEKQKSSENPSFISSQPQPTIELKNGYFFFTDSKMRKIYDKGGWDVQISGSYPLWRWLQLYASIEYLEKRGNSLFDKQKTSIWEIPINLGLKPVFPICSWMQYYFAAGFRYVFAHQTNHSSYVDRHLSQNGLGGFVNTGFNFIFWRHFLVDLFGEYSYVKLRFHPHKKNVEGRDMQLGGLTFGVGLGYAF